MTGQDVKGRKKNYENPKRSRLLWKDQYKHKRSEGLHGYQGANKVRKKRKMKSAAIKRTGGLGEFSKCRLFLQWRKVGHRKKIHQSQGRTERVVRMCGK